MPRNYKLKFKRQRHSKEELDEAVRAVIADGSTVRSVADTYGISRSTLHDHVKSVRLGDERKVGPGRKTALPESVEEYLVEGPLKTALSLPPLKTALSLPPLKTARSLSPLKTARSFRP